MSEHTSASFPNGPYGPNAGEMHRANVIRGIFEGKIGADHAPPDTYFDAMPAEVHTGCYSPWAVQRKNWNPKAPENSRFLSEAEMDDLFGDSDSGDPLAPARGIFNGLLIIGAALVLGFAVMSAWAALHPLPERQAAAAVHGFEGGK